jgi:DNA modification methylase
MILDPSLWGSYAGTFADWEEEGVTEPYYQTPDGKVTLLHGHVLDVLREMPAESVNCVVTSPPYWSLRKYDCEPVIWGGDPNCPHTLEAQPVGGESYEGKARWQHDGVSRQETPEAWVKESYVRNNDQTAGDKQRTNVGAIGRDSPIDHATCSLCGAWRGQYGLEPTPELYVEHTMMWLREVRRVLKPTGTVWLNIGDSYASGKGTCYNPGGGAESWETPRKEAGLAYPLDRGSAVTLRQSGLKPKDAVLMPFRVTLAAQADGWWVRSVIIWAKPNPMPESVRDRPTDAHEYIFLLTKSKTYFYDAEAIREPMAESSIARISQPTFDKQTGGPKDYSHGTNPNRSARKALENFAASHKGSYFDKGKTAEHQLGRASSEPRHDSPNGRNCRSVWTFPTEPFPDAHFAVFPRELPERCIKAGCPEWVCPKCGKARTRVTETALTVHDGKTESAYPKGTTANRLALLRQAARERGSEYVNERQTVAWSDCYCNAGFPGGVVLDPFVGSGTTCEVAYHLRRTAWGIDASAKYLDMAIERVKQGVLL